MEVAMSVGGVMKKLAEGGKWCLVSIEQQMNVY
jgi:hypothetical protein